MGGVPDIPDTIRAWASLRASCSPATCVDPFRRLVRQPVRLVRVAVSDLVPHVVGLFDDAGRRRAGVLWARRVFGGGRRRTGRRPARPSQHDHAVNVRRRDIDGVAVASSLVRSDRGWMRRGRTVCRDVSAGDFRADHRSDPARAAGPRLRHMPGCLSTSGLRPGRQRPGSSRGSRTRRCSSVMRSLRSCSA